VTGGKIWVWFILKETQDARDKGTEATDDEFYFDYAAMLTLRKQVLEMQEIEKINQKKKTTRLSPDIKMNQSINVEVQEAEV